MDTVKKVGVLELVKIAGMKHAPNYRIAQRKSNRCKNCSSYKGRYCTKFKFVASQDGRCDAFTQKKEAKT